jgi:predicted amidohydrolase YtcJ
LLGLASPPAEPRRADLLLTGGVVHTLDPARPRAEAVAVAAGRVLAVGSAAELAALKGPSTRVVDLAGRTVLPGFIDSHAHLLGIGAARLGVDLRGTTSWREVLERVQAALPGQPPGQWVVGRGWHEDKWTDRSGIEVRGFPTHRQLSAMTPDRPVVLERADGHAVLANARAMAERGIDRNTRTPAGGEIVKDGAGEPTGVFVDNAAALVEPPPADAARKRRALDLALAECARQGVTTLHDAGASPEEIALYRERAAAHTLTVRLYVMVGGVEAMRALGRPLVPPAGEFVTVRAVKLYADGALGSRGAALLEPYLDDPGNRGLLVTPFPQLLDAARIAAGSGFQVCTHAIGDRANRLTLDAYEQVLRESQKGAQARWRIEHAQVLDAADVPRFGQLGVIASMQTIHATSDRPWAADRLGLPRVKEGAYAWQKLLRSGARLANGTDAPVEDLSPIRSFHAAVTRQDASGKPPGGFDPEEKLSRPEALQSMTLGGAYAAFEEDFKGSLVPGKLADLVVLSRDIMSIPEPEILGAEVVLTVVGGKVVYEAGAPN